MIKLKNCPLSKHEVRMYATAGHCPRIECICGLEFSHCDIRKPEELADRWNGRIENDVEILQNKYRSDAWHAVCEKMDELGISRNSTPTGLGGVLAAIEELHAQAQRAPTLPANAPRLLPLHVQIEQLVNIKKVADEGSDLDKAVDEKLAGLVKQFGI